MNTFKVGDKVVRRSDEPSAYFGKFDYYVVEEVSEGGYKIRLEDDDNDRMFWDAYKFELYSSKEDEPVIEISHLKEVMKSLMELYQSKEKTLEYLGAYLAGYERGCNK